VKMRVPGSFDHIWIEGLGIRRSWVEMCDSLLEPRDDVGHGRHVIVRNVAADIVTEPQVDTIVPKLVRMLISLS